MEFLPFPLSLDMLTQVGLTILTVYAVGRLFSRFGSPQVVGFIVAGVLLGPSFLHLIPNELNESLLFVSEIALGLIGFDMGSHLRFSELRKLGKSIIFIVLMQLVGAAGLVALGVYAITGELHTALVFGAISAATAPAATVDVLAEYKSEGPLTTTLLAVVGLDDMLTLLLFSIAAALAESVLVGGQGVTVAQMLELPLVEIGGSLAFGVVAGLILDSVRSFVSRGNDIVLVAIGAIFVCAGLARTTHLSLILTTMVMGAVVVNRNPDNGRRIRHVIETAGPLVYILFFALAGARLRLDLLPTIGLLGIAYTVLRIVGKYAGAWLGGRIGGAEPVVRNYLGLALLSQAGVAIGLALESHARFGALGPEGEALGSLVLGIITATMLVVQIIGPLGVKLAITRAGEIGNATSAEFWAGD